MKTVHTRWINIALLLVVNALWAAFYFANKWVNLGPVTTSTWSFLIALPVLLPFLLWERWHSESHRDFLKAAAPQSRSFRRQSNLVGFVAVGLLGLLPAAAFMAWGEQHTTATNAALLGLSVPVMTPLLAFLVLREKLPGRGLLGLGVAMVGALVLSLGNLESSETGASAGSSFWATAAGNALVLLSCASSCFYNVYSKELLRRFSPLEVLVVGYALALLISIPLLVWLEPVSFSAISEYSLKRWAGLLILGTLVWGLAMVLWLRLLARIDVSLASISIYLLPLFGVLFSAVLLGERLTGATMIGGAIALAGAMFSVLSSPGSRAKEAV